MPELEPRFILIGSIAEGIRIYSAAELDITVTFNGLKKKPLFMGDDAFTLKLNSDQHPLERWSGNEVLNYQLFFRFFLTNLADIIESRRETIQELTQDRIKIPIAKFLPCLNDVCCLNGRNIQVEIFTLTVENAFFQ